jgi:hypothetical protein
MRDGSTGAESGAIRAAASPAGPAGHPTTKDFQEIGDRAEADEVSEVFLKTMSSDHVWQCAGQFFGDRPDFLLARRTKAVTFVRSRDLRGDVVDIALPASTDMNKGKFVTRSPVRACTQLRGRHVPY